MIDASVLPFAYLNGKILPVEQAHVPALDRGFLFGDAIYEVVPVYSGVLFRTASHVERLMSGLEKIQIVDERNAADWTEILERVVEANGDVDQYVYIQVTRGVSRYRDHATPKDIQPLVFAMSQRLATRPERMLERGVDAVLLQDTRWSRCDIKSTSLLANVLLRQSALEQDCTEAILHRDGWVTEGAASTVLMVKDSTLIVPPDTHQILPGTTRRLVEELADQIGLACETRPFKVDEIRVAEEVLLTAATKEVIPVCTLDNKPVGNGKPGPWWKQLNAAYKSYIAQIISR